MQSIAQSTLIQAAGDRWKDATESAFLNAIGDGTLPGEAFERWLVQDYRFVQGLASFQAVAAAKCPRDAQRSLIAGLASLDAELDWFESKLAERNLDGDVEPHPICRRYVDFLVAAAYTQPPGVLLAIVFGVEVCYLAGWSQLEPNGPYAEFIERWSSEPFRVYVDSLRELCVRHRHPEQQSFFNDTLRHERDFWRMTWEG